MKDERCLTSLKYIRRIQWWWWLPSCPCKRSNYNFSSVDAQCDVTRCNDVDDVTIEPPELIRVLNKSAECAWHRPLEFFASAVRACRLEGSACRWWIPASDHHGVKGLLCDWSLSTAASDYWLVVSRHLFGDIVLALNVRWFESTCHILSAS